MHLADFLDARGISDADFGLSIGVSRQAVHRYRHGRIPDRTTMAKIIEVTGGAVTANDFFSAPAEEPAA